MAESYLEIKEDQRLFLAGYTNFSVKRAGVMTCPYPNLGARLEVESDLAPLFPYINGSVNGARYLESPERIQFIFEGVQCTLYSYEIVAAAFSDHDHARVFGENLLDFLNALHGKRNSIKPNYRKSKHLSVIDIYKVLPKTNCGECGLPSCLAFAGALSKGKTGTAECPGFAQPIEAKAVYPIVDGQGQLISTIELDLPEQGVMLGRQQSKLQSILTGRELQVLKRLAQGLTNPEISEQLFISPHTVKSHVVHIYEKLGVNDRAQAAVVASRHKLI